MKINKMLKEKEILQHEIDEKIQSFCNKYKCKDIDVDVDCHRVICSDSDSLIIRTTIDVGY